MPQLLSLWLPYLCNNRTQDIPCVKAPLLRNDCMWTTELLQPYDAFFSLLFSSARICVLDLAYLYMYFVISIIQIPQFVPTRIILSTAVHHLRLRQYVHHLLIAHLLSTTHLSVNTPDRFGQ